MIPPRIEIIIPNPTHQSTAHSYKQPEFAFTGQPSRDTRAASFAATHDTAPARRAAVESAFRSAGSAGLTRSELADLLDVPPNHICRPVLDLLTLGLLVECGRKRPSRWGRNGAVLVLAGYVTHDLEGLQA